MISTKVSSVISPLQLVEKEGNLKIAVDFANNGDTLLSIDGLSNLKLGKASTIDVLNYSKITDNSAIIDCKKSDQCICLRISSIAAKDMHTTSVRICTKLVLQYAETFIKKTHGTNFYYKKYK